MTENDPTTTAAEDRPRSRARRALAIAVGAIVTAIVLLALLHVFIRPVPPDQEAPAEHFGEPCGLCHLVTDSAQPVEVE